MLKNKGIFKIFVILLLLFSLEKVFSQELRKIKNEAFQRGEKMLFRVFYDSQITGEVNAGIASLEVKKENKKIAGRNTYTVVGEGKSLGAFNLFFRVVDYFETVFDEEAIAPWVFVRRTDEGGYKINEDIVFNQFKNTASSNNKKPKELPPYTQDIISAFYYARTLDLSNLKPGDEIVIPFFLDDTLYTSKVIYLGKETITTFLGKFRALKFKPMVAVGTVFKDPYPMTLWITDDKNRLPLLAESGVIVGKVKMELIKVTGIRNPVTSLIKD